jgi:hypothetical protein
MDVTKPYEFIGFGAMDVTTNGRAPNGVLAIPDTCLTHLELPSGTEQPHELELLYVTQ